jgi:tight adherence protein C
MEYAVAAFIIIFLLAASGLLLIFYRERLGQRIGAILAPSGDTGRLPESFRRAVDTLGGFAGSIQKVVPKTGKEISLVQRRLVRAGFRNEGALDVLYSSKALMPVLLCVTAVATDVYRWEPFVVCAITLVFGYLIPDFVLDHKIKARADQIRSALPDSLDLLVVCLEAGLSLDQAVLRASDELRSTHPALSEELGLVMLDIRAGRHRMDAWRSFAERTDQESTRLLVSILLQADQFGSGISKTLRVHSDGMRIRRRQRVEEMAAKTHVKLVFPLVLFIFPSLFVVTIGPAVITLAEAFKK